MERENVFYIKNMVCNRCILVVTRLLEKAGFTPLDVGLGTVVVQEKPGREQREAFRKLLEAYGFELIDDSRMRLIEQIRTAVIELVHYSEDASKVNLSDYLRERCHRDYSALSKLFSEVNGISIEKYFLAQRIERVKELLAYGDLTVSEIAYATGFADVCTFSRFFAKGMGMSPTKYRLAFA